MNYRPEQWLGNQWPSIEIDPVGEAYFLPILSHLASSYGFPLPDILWDVDGCSAEFEIAGAAAIIKVDSWTFSIAFERETVRDQVLALLRALPDDTFG